MGRLHAPVDATTSAAMTHVLCLMKLSFYPSVTGLDVQLTLTTTIRRVNALVGPGQVAAGIS